MKLVLLGTSGYHSTNRRETACLMLPELGVVFDAGSAMHRVPDYACTEGLDIYLTHAHLDHVLGLTFMFDILAASDLKRVTAHGEKSKLDAIRTHLFSELVFPVEPPFEMRELAAKIRIRGGGVLTHFPLRHPGGSVGFRVDWPDRSMAYVTDTVACPKADYVELIRGVNLLIHECYFDDDQPNQAELTGHSCVTPVAQVAAAAEVGRMVLVHINPLLKTDADFPLAKAKQIFPRTEIGTDYMELEF